MSERLLSKKEVCFRLTISRATLDRPRRRLRMPDRRRGCAGDPRPCATQYHFAGNGPDIIYGSGNELLDRAFARADGTVLFRLTLLRTLLVRAECPDAAVVAVAAHEFGRVGRLRPPLSRKGRRPAMINNLLKCYRRHWRVGRSMRASHETASSNCENPGAI